MPQTSFCLTDWFDGALRFWSAYNGELPPANASDDDPSVPMEAKAGAFGSFEWELGMILDVLIGAGPATTATIAPGHYDRTALLAALEVSLKAIDATFTVGASNDRVWISRGAGPFSILWDTGANASASNRAWAELGYDNAADDTGFSIYDADELRYSTHTYLIFDLGSARSLSSFWLVLDGDDETDYSDVRLYAHSGFLGQMRQQWSLGATVDLAYSVRPLIDESNVQIAHQGAATPASRRWYCFSWRHRDESPVHRVGLCKGFGTTWDGTNGKTIQVLTGHRLGDRSTPIGDDHSRGVGRILRWIVPLKFRLWPVVSYRDVFHDVIRHGRNRGIGWFLDFAGVLSGSVTINLAVDRGEIVWTSLQDQDDGDNFGAAESSHVSGSILLQQIK